VYRFSHERAQNRDRWQALVNAVMNIRIPQNVGISLLGKMERYLNVGRTYGAKAFSSILGKWLIVKLVSNMSYKFCLLFTDRKNTCD
jgi:hypothetical protein